MKLYLLENYNSSIKFDDDSVIIALTPMACYALDKADIEYSIIEDYYNEIELLAGEEKWFELQREWIRELDKFLQNNIHELKELDIKLAEIYFWYLRGMVLDPLYIRCFTMKKLFEKVHPSSVTYISQKSEESQLNYRFENYDGSYYSQLISIFCKEYNVPLSFIFIEGEKNTDIKSIGVTNKAIKYMESLYYNHEIIRKIFFLYKRYKQYPFLRKKSSSNSSNIFLLKTAHIGHNFIIDAMNRGHTVYQLYNDNYIIKYFLGGPKKYLEFNKEFNKNTTDLININIWEITANLLDRDTILTMWFNREYRIDISEIILLRLKHFISNLCPEILSYFKQFSEFYTKENINFVFTPTVSSLCEYAALAAANHCDGVRTVGLQHGNEIFLNPIWYDHEMSHYDIYFCTDKEIENHFKLICKNNQYSTKIYHGLHSRLSNAKCISENKSSTKSNKIIYLSGILTWDRRRRNSCEYPDTWYYNFQKELIRYFSTKKEFIFLWEYRPLSNAVYNPIYNFISDNNFSNIVVVTNVLNKYLHSADKVICDYPSTGFYVSTVAGIRTMSLCHSSFKVRKTALEQFNGVVEIFSTIPEAINYIEEFINREPAEVFEGATIEDDKTIIKVLEENNEI